MASTSRAASVFPLPKASLKDYLVGSQLDDALAKGEDIVISYPFADGDVKDFTQAEAIWYVEPKLSFVIGGKKRELTPLT